VATNTPLACSTAEMITRGLLVESPSQYDVGRNADGGTRPFLTPC
jgi:hypothetical protein